MKNLRVSKFLMTFNISFSDSDKNDKKKWVTLGTIQNILKQIDYLKKLIK